MNLNPVVLSIPIYFLLIGIELIIQQFSKARLYRFNDALTNISCGITQQLTGVFLKIFSIGIYQFVYENFGFWNIPSNIYSLIILFVLVDLCYYWAHRKSHEINLFWGGHVVHHQSEEYNLSVALRQSSFQVIWTFAFYLPLALIGFNTLDFVLMNALTTVYQFWIHTETIGKLGIFEYVFNTPSHHRVHHGRDPKYIDKNHAGVFIVWDKMFGTFQPEEEKPTYGITRPLNSWNPVWANLEHYYHMTKMLPKIKGWRDRILFLFNKPGWLPEYLGGYQAPPPIQEIDTSKYDFKASTRTNYYVLYQYAITLLLTSLFLFNQAAFTMNQKVLFVTGVIITIVNCGALFESRPWVKTLELLRVLSLSAVGFFLSYTFGWDILWISASLFYIATSLPWLLVLLFSKTSQT